MDPHVRLPVRSSLVSAPTVHLTPDTPRATSLRPGYDTTKYKQGHVI